MSWEDGGPLDPAESGDYESTVERARDDYARCPECDGPTREWSCGEPGDTFGRAYGLTCATAGAEHWRMTDDQMVNAWAEAHEPDAPEAEDRDGR